MTAPDPALLAATGDPRVDATLAGAVALFTRSFPGRVRSVFIEGSRADDTGLVTSDLDLIIVFRERFADEAERARASEIAEVFARSCAVEFDAEIADESALARGVFPSLKEGSLLAWGEDIRPGLPVMPLAAWTRDRLHSSYWRAVTLFDRPTPVRLPLVPPDPADEFFGYCRRPLRLPDSTTVPSTRDLVRHTGWAATGLLALRAGRYVARKRDCHRLYAALIGDEWADLLTALYERCRGEWRYRIPTDPAGRAALRSLCARTLDFENDFLGVYRAFLLDELRGDDEEGRAFARRVLGRLPLDDAEVITACG